MREASLEIEVTNTELNTLTERQKELNEELASCSAEFEVVRLDKLATEKNTVEPDPDFDKKLAELTAGIESEKALSESLSQQVEEFRELISAQSVQIDDNRRQKDEFVDAETVLRLKLKSGKLEIE